MTHYLEINGWEANLTFHASHVLPRHLHCGRLHGHTYAVSVRVDGDLEEEGMILDFSILKKAIRDILSDLDHTVLIPRDNPHVSFDGGMVMISTLHHGAFSMPKDLCMSVPVKETTAENLSRYILGSLLERLDTPKNVTRMAIGVSEGPGQTAWTAMDL